MKTYLGIDPGPTESAYCLLRDNVPLAFSKVPNQALREYLANNVQYDVVCIEHFQSFGMALGKSSIDTMYVIGELRHQLSSAGKSWHPVLRGQIKMHHCKSMRAKDSNIRQAMLDRFGEDSIKKGGVLYKCSKDCWSSLAIACFAYDTKLE